MNDASIRKQIHHAMDTRLSGLTGDAQLARRVALKAESAGKGKRVSVGLAVAVALLILALGALAATLLWEQYVGWMIGKEQEAGAYAQWSAGDKAALVEALVEMGYVETIPETQALLDGDLPEADRAALADRLVLDFLAQSPYIQDYTTSFNHQVDSVTSGLLTMAILGSQDEWPAEKRVWWQRLMHPHVSSVNDMPFVNPEPGDLSEEEAIALARRVVTDVLNVPESELDAAQAVADLYVTDERPEYRRWFVTFNIFAEGSRQDVERWYEVFIDSAGNLIADPDYGTELPEAKAGYSADARERVLAALERGDLAALTNPYVRYPAPHGELIASTACAYGLPGEDDIPLDEAWSLARLYLWNAYGLDEQESADSYLCYEYYDITAPERPLWKFVFTPESFEGMSAVPVYKVELDAYTGEPVSMRRDEWKEIFARPPYDPIWY